MDEKLFKTMGRIGGANIAMGVICIVIGVVVGVLSIICGGKLLKDKNNMLFKLKVRLLNKRKRTLCPFLLFFRF